MPTNLTGSQGNQTLDCTVTQYNVSANCTQQAGTTTAFTPGTGPVQHVTWAGNFNFTSSTSGNITAIGTSALHLVFKPSGAVTTWAGAGFPQAYIYHSSTGAGDFQYCDTIFIGLVLDVHSGAANATYDHIRTFNARPTNGSGIYIGPAGGTNTYTNLEA